MLRPKKGVRDVVIIRAPNTIGAPLSQKFGLYYNPVNLPPNCPQTHAQLRHCVNGGVNGADVKGADVKGAGLVRLYYMCRLWVNPPLQSRRQDARHFNSGWECKILPLKASQPEYLLLGILAFGQHIINR